MKIVRYVHCVPTVWRNAVGEEKHFRQLGPRAHPHTRQVVS